MHSIYIGQLLRPTGAPLIVCMSIHLGGVAMVCNYPHPAIIQPNIPKNYECGKYDELRSKIHYKFTSKLNLPGDLIEKYTANLYHSIPFTINSMTFIRK